MIAEPRVILVASPHSSMRARLVEAVGRAGHPTMQVPKLEDEESRRGRRTPDVLVCDSAAWRFGKEFLAEYGSPRVLLVADDTARRHRVYLEEEGVEAFASDHVSDIEIFCLLEELLSRSSRPMDVSQAGDARSANDSGAPEDVSVAVAVRELEERIERGDVPVTPLAPSGVELMDVIGDPKSTAADLLGRVEQEPSLVAAVVREANGPLHRGQAKVVSLSAAARRVGRRRVGEVAQREALKGGFSGQSAGWDRVLARLWQNTVVTAHAARKLGEALGYRDPDTLYSLALFADIGQAALVDLYRGLGKAPPEDGMARGELASLLASEHAALSAKMLQAMGMPSSTLAIALQHHHPIDLSPRTPLGRAGWILAAASGAVVAAGCVAWEGQRPEPDQRIAAATLGVDVSLLAEIAEDAIEDWEGRSASGASDELDDEEEDAAVISSEDLEDVVEEDEVEAAAG